MASESIIREVAKDVWTFSRPFIRFGILPIGGRSTAIKLRSGGVWVLASTPLEPETKAKLDELGAVKYIVSGDANHYIYLGDFKRAYPDAKLIAPNAAIEALGDKELVFDGAWGRDPPDTKYGFEDEIKAWYFPGFKNRGVAFFHPESKSLIEADLLFNLPAKEQYSKSPSYWNRPFFNFSPDSWLHKRFVWRWADDRDAMRRDAKVVSGWDFEKIIPCHGDVIEKDGKKAWNAAYEYYFQNT